MNNINLMVEEKKKKEKRKKIIKLSLIFTALVLILTWFVASFIHNKPVNNEEVKSELIQNDHKNYSKKNSDYDIELVDEIYYLNYYCNLMYFYSEYFYDGDDYILSCYCDIYITYDLTNKEYSEVYLSYDFGNGYDSYYGEYYFDVDDFNISNYYRISFKFGYFQDTFSNEESSIYYLFENYDLEYFDENEFPLSINDGLVFFPFENGSEYGYYQGEFDNSYIFDLLTDLYLYSDYQYEEGYAHGDNDGYIEGILDNQKGEIALNGFKTLFNAILNAPYNIYVNLLNFDFLGVNLFNLFSFIFTTSLILWVISILKK